MEHGLPYIEPSSGYHSGPRNREQDRQDAITYLTNGRRIPSGPGKHRRRESPYAHFRYQVIEKEAA